MAGFGLPRGLIALDPDSSTWISLGALFLSLLLLAFASLAQSSLALISKARVRQLAGARSASARALKDLLDRPDLSVSFIILESLAFLVAASLATLLAMKHLIPVWGVVGSIALLALVALLFSKVAPRTLAERHLERTTLLTINLARALAWVLRPLSWFFLALAHLLISPFGGGKGHQTGEAREDELRLLAEMEADGGIPGEERRMIRAIFRLEDTTAREIMVPRVDIVAADCQESLSSLVKLIVEYGRSRIPIYEDNIDNVIGILYAKDLLQYLNDGDSSVSLRQILRPAYFIPESKKLDELLRELQQRRVHMAIVVDEYGGTAGLVTIEDLLEEIVGEIEDEYDKGEAQIERLSENAVVMEGKASIGELNELFDVQIEGEDFDTVGGFVYKQLGKIPSPGDEIKLGPLTISVLSTLGRRIKKVRIEREQRDEL